MKRRLPGLLQQSAVDRTGRWREWLPWSTSSSFRRAILPLIVLFAVSLPAVTPRLYGADEIEYFAYLRSMWFDRDLSFDNEYHYFYDRGIAHGRNRDDGQGFNGDTFKTTFLEAETPTGLRINFAPIGTAILWAPFYAVADAGVRVARALGLSSIPADGFSQPYLTAVTYASAVYGFLAILLSAWTVWQIFGDADLSVVAVWLGTPLLFYMYVAPGYSHGCSAFAVALFVVVWMRVRQRWTLGGIVTLGALAALMGMVREQDGFIAIGPAVDCLATALRSVATGAESAGRWTMRVVAGVITTAVCALPQAITYLTLYGGLGPSHSVAEKMYWTAPYAWRVLASTEHGAIFWTPLLVPALAGLGLLAASWNRDHQVTADGGLPDRARIGAVLLLMVLTQLWISGSVASWTGSAFGQRRLLGLTICFVVGLSAVSRALQQGWPRRVFAVGVAACVWWNLGLIAQYGTGLADRERLELRVNAYHNFITVPRLIPTLAYRYLFDRSSFYQRPSGRPAPAG